MHSIITLITLVFSALAAHPVETAATAYIALCALNGALPRTVITGPVGAVMHVALDRLAVLVRRDARGTLKLPFAASVVVMVADSLVDALEPRAPSVVRTEADLSELEGIARAHAQNLGPDVDDASRELTEGLLRGHQVHLDAAIPTPIAPVAAPAGSRAGERGRAELRALVVLAVLSVLSVACSGGALAAAGAAADTANEVVLVARKVRAALCAEQLDPYLGAVRERVVVVHDVALDGGAAADAATSE